MKFFLARGLVITSLFFGVAGVASSIVLLLRGPEVKTIVTHKVYDVPLTRFSTLEEALRHFHLGTRRRGGKNVQAFTGTRQFPDGICYDYYHLNYPKGQKWFGGICFENGPSTPPQGPNLAS